jgi:hypothetical protein
LKRVVLRRGDFKINKQYKMDKDFFVKQLDEIIEEFHGFKSNVRNGDISYFTNQQLSLLISKSKAAVERIVGNKSEYYKDIDEILKKDFNFHSKFPYIIGTVIALRSDLINGYLKSVSEIIQSEVFSDYLDMAEHLLQEGYKDPSAVLIGSTLEVHLRELCVTNDISIEVPNPKGKIIPKKADVMNADLTKLNIYSSAYQKQIIAWLGIRNSAAHGKYDEYTPEEIKLMLQGVRNFILSTK